MHRPSHLPRTLEFRRSARWVSRGRDASISLARLALICYLMPVILLVFAVGGLGIATTHLSRLFHKVGEPLHLWPSSSRRPLYLTISSRKPIVPRGAELYHKPRGIR